MSHDNRNDANFDETTSGLTPEHEDSLDLYRERLRAQPITPRQWIRENGHLNSTPAFRELLWSYYVVAYPPPCVPGFVIEDVLGEGGMGRVYLGCDQSLGRRVALKELTAALQSDGRFTERFRREAKILARLKHPNIVNVHQFVKNGESEFIVMEYLSEGSLADRLGNTTADVTTLPGMIAKLARASDYAHSEGIIHRDVKPANILLGRDGEPKLGDFGLAKDLFDPLDLTRGAVLGTHHYMAPEQVEGKTPVPGTDIWAFGVILFRVISGRFPFDGHTVADLHTAIRTALPAELPTETPTGLRRICLRCLEKDPAKRFERGSELAAALEKVAGSQSTPRAPKSRPSRRLVVVAALALALIAVAALSMMVRRNHPPNADAFVAMPEKLSGPTKSIAFSADGRYGLVEVGGSQLVVWDLRKEQIFKQLGHGLQTRKSEMCGSVAVSANGKRVAAIGLNPAFGRLTLVELFDPDRFDKIDVLVDDNVYGRAIAFSNDGKRLALEKFERGTWGSAVLGGPGKSHILVYDIDSRKSTDFPLQSSISCLAFSPEGRFVFAGGADSHISVWDLTNRSKDRDIAVPTGGIDEVVCSEDDARIYTASIANDTLGVFTRSGANEKMFITTSETLKKTTCAALSFRGRAITGHRDGTLVCWDLETGAMVSVRHSEAEVTALALSPDGRQALVAYSDGVIGLQQLTTPLK